MKLEWTGEAIVQGSQESRNESSSGDVDFSKRRFNTEAGLFLSFFVMAIAVALVLSVVLVGMPSQKSKTLAPAVPYIIYGYSYDEYNNPLPFSALKVVDRTSGESCLTSSDSAGKYQFDLSELPSEYQAADIVWLLGYNGTSIGLNKTSVTGSGGKWLNITLSPHTPIRIDGDSDFDVMHGVSSGSGSSSDPYVIENRDINGAGFGYCIYIGNTTAHYVVRDCQLHHASSMYDPNLWHMNSGFILYRSSDALILNNTAYLNTGPAIYVYRCENDTIANNSCSNNDRGMYLGMLSNSVICNNSILSCTGDGMFVSASSRNVFSNNTVLSSGAAGISICWNSNYNTIVDNICRSNGYCGINLQTSFYNNVTQNNCGSANWFGMIIRESGGNLVSDNNCSSNTASGIVLSISGSNTIVNNTCSYNAQRGISLDSSSDGNTISNNTCLSNTQEGIYIESSVSNRITNNTCVHDRYGIQLFCSNGSNVLEMNNCSNGVRGIYVLSSSGNSLFNNTCIRNEYGIHLYTSSDSNRVVGNNCSSNLDRGIYVHTSNANEISDNNCSSNSLHGIYLYSSSNSTIDGNACNWNGKYGLYMNQNCSYNVLSNNTCVGNQYGVYFLSSVIRAVVFQNEICHNTNYGVYVSSSTGSRSTFWNNTLCYNNGALDSYDVMHLQAYDAGTDNWWNSSDGYGNWWSDWTSPDADEDGFVDSPYVFTSNQDNYPWANALWQFNFTLNLHIGWNLISMPMVDFAYNASTLGLATGDTVVRWSSSTQTYDAVYIVGVSPPSVDFQILPGMGYFLSSGSEKDIVLTGDTPEKLTTWSCGLDVPTGGGWVNIGWISLNESRHASDIASFVSGSHAKFVCRYDAVAEKYVSYIVGFSSPEYDFSVAPGDGMWIWVDAPGGTLSYSTG